MLCSTSQKALIKSTLCSRDKLFLMTTYYYDSLVEAYRRRHGACSGPDPNSLERTFLMCTQPASHLEGSQNSVLARCGQLPSAPIEPEPHPCWCGSDAVCLCTFTIVTKVCALDFYRYSGLLITLNLEFQYGYLGMCLRCHSISTSGQPIKLNIPSNFSRTSCGLCTWREK